jgi:hypothetical protein
MSYGWRVTQWHESFSAWIPPVLHVASHVSAASGFYFSLGPAIAVHLFPFQPDRDYAAMQHLFKERLKHYFKKVHKTKAIDALNMTRTWWREKYSSSKTKK